MKEHSILLVDDEESIRVTVANDLTKAGYDVTAAESGEQAVEELKEDHFDLVITDLIMDGMDGIGVLREARKLHPDILVMILTGYGSLSSAVDALRAGAFDYMLKPCDKDELLIRTSRCVEHLKLNRKIKIYEKILVVCCVCKKIRDDDGREPGTGVWKQPDVYLEQKTGIQASHTYCDECADDFLKELPEP